MSTYLWRPVLTRTQRKTLTFKHFRTGSRTINGSFKTYQNVVWSWPMCTQLKCDSSIFPPIFVECKAPSMTKDFSFNTKYVVIITVITSRASYRVKWSIWYQDVAESKSLFQVGNTESILRNFKSGKKKKPPNSKSPIFSGYATSSRDDFQEALFSWSWPGGQDLGGVVRPRDA